MPLSPHTLTLINTLRDRLHNGKPLRILFVCLGNICRSPAAEGIFRQMAGSNQLAQGWTIDSAGTGAYHIGDLPDHRMRIHAQRRGYTLTHHARQVREADFDNFDIIIAMDHSNLANLRRLAPTPRAEAKIVSMAEFLRMASRYDHIPDPYYEGAQGFELVLDLLEDSCRHLLELLTRADS